MWWIWLLVALGAVAAELAFSGLIFGGLAGAALVATVIAALVPSLVVQAAAFAGTTVLYLLALRPTALRMLTSQSSLRLGSHGGPVPTMGRRAVVTEEVTPDGGQIRFGKGEYWSARSYDGKDVIEVGASVEVVVLEGLTALVWRTPPSS